MGWKDKLKGVVEAKKAQLRRGVEVSEQMRAERLRRLRPGTMRYGLAHKQKVGDFMKDAYDRRKAKREDQKKQG
jgi:hypothetical protein